MANSYFNENTLEELIEEIKYVYKSDDRPWVIGYSGGKDSTTVVELVYKMLLGLDPEDRHKNVYIVSSDTLIENPLIKIYLSKMNDLLGQAADRDGYVGVNSHYISKIKDLINSKAFQQEVVESEVQLTLQLKIERDIRNYVITRKWDYTNQKLTEEYTVARDGKLLNDQELSYFENYLRSIIPPDLFEFFLFDGEEVGNIFSTSAYNTYVRNAVFTMCGMDVFEIIRKFTRGYVTKNNSNDDDEVYDTYESAKQQIETLETEKENLDVEVGNLTKELENIDIQLTELATAFKNAGGISRKEKKQLEDEYALAEKVKTESLTNIKLFVEGLMPFYILRDLANPIMAQLDFEEKGEIFYYVQSKLKRDAISDLLKGDVSDAKVDQLMDHLLDTFRPKGFREDMEMMFDLSKEDILRRL